MLTREIDPLIIRGPKVLKLCTLKTRYLIHVSNVKNKIDSYIICVGLSNAQAVADARGNAGVMG